MDGQRIQSNTGRPVTFASSAAVAVTASDTDVFGAGCLFVGTGGDVAVKLADSTTTVVFKGIVDGSFLPIVVTQVLATGTVGAGDFVILY